MTIKIDLKNKVFVILVYLLFIAFLCLNAFAGKSWIVVVIMSLVTILLGISIVVNQIKIFLSISSYLNDQKRNCLYKQMVFMKISLIPYFILNFLYWVIAIGLVPMGFVGIIYLPMIIAFTYSVVIVSGCVGTVAIVAYKRAGYLHKNMILLHIILQFIFVLDVIDTMYIMKKIKEEDIDG